MTYRVVYTPALRAQVAAQVAYMREQEASEAAIEEWFTALFDRIDALEQWPRRYPIADHVSIARDVEVRRLVFGSYVVLYRIEEPARVVHVIAFYHGGRSRPTL